MHTRHRIGISGAHPSSVNHLSVWKVFALLPLVLARAWQRKHNVRGVILVDKVPEKLLYAPRLWAVLPGRNKLEELDLVVVRQPQPRRLQDVLLLLQVIKLTAWIILNLTVEACDAQTDLPPRAARG